ncbi:MAG TPA: GMC family oxidoreductase, partial [Jiangellaceae bacterium]|nr:GMC family oxidoreductase [Jiangellaceae bacterium]
ETMAGLISDESGLNTDRGFVGGYYLQTIALGPAFFGAFVAPGRWGPEFTKYLDAYANTAGMWIVGEDMPQETNRITLNTDVTDANGLPVANVHVEDHPNDVAMRNHALTQGQALYNSVGAIRTIATPPYPSTHNLGTCRMSERPGDGVVDRHGRAHDVPNLFISDGSQFTTGAAANPTLTIVSLAIRQAEYIAEAYRRSAA